MLCPELLAEVIAYANVFPATACFVRLEEHCSSLQTTRGQLERLWEEKGTQLDKVLQLRVFEHDSEQLAQWILHEANSLAHEHTDIGNSQTSAELKRKAFEDFGSRMKVSLDNYLQLTGSLTAFEILE